MRTRLSRRLFLALPLLLLGALAWHTWRNVRQARLDNELVAAVEASNLARVNAVLDQGADPNARPVERAESLWGRALDAMLGRRRPGGCAVVYRAAPHWALTETLVQHGANPNASCDGVPVLTLVAKFGPPSTVRCLIDHGANVRACSPEGFSALHAAAWDHHGAEKAMLLLRAGADTGENRPLARAARDGDMRTVSGLIRVGLGPRKWDGEPLVLAAACGHQEIVRRLLAAGADPTCRAAWRGRLVEPSEVAGTRELARLLRAAADRQRRSRP